MAKLNELQKLHLSSLYDDAYRLLSETDELAQETKNVKKTEWINLHNFIEEVCIKLNDLSK